MTTAPNFDVLAADDRNEPTFCSTCARSARHLVVVPLKWCPGLDLRAPDGDELWMGLCAYCVLAMAKALAAAEGKA